MSIVVVCVGILENRRSLGNGQPARVYLAGDVGDIATFVAGIGKIDFDAVRFQPAQPNADAENIHLPAGVVDVVLTMHGITDRLEQVTDGCAKSGATTVADMQGAGRVGGNVFEQDAWPVPGRLPTILFTVVEDVPDLVMPGNCTQVEIDESGAGNLDLVDGVALSEPGDYSLGQRARITVRRLGQAHRDVAREVTVARVARSLQGAYGREFCGVLLDIRQCGERVVNRLCDQGLHRAAGILHHHNSIGSTSIDQRTFRAAGSDSSEGLRRARMACRARRFELCTSNCAR